MALPFRQPTPGFLDGIPHAGIDLFLHVPVAGPPYGHAALLAPYLMEP
jgi:hypothetical protein